MRDLEHMEERLAALADVEADDTSLALAWIATEGGGDDEEDAEILRSNDGLIRRFDRLTGMWCVLDKTDTLQRVSEFLCEVGDAKLEAVEARFRQGEIEKKDRLAAKKLYANLRSTTRRTAVWQTAVVNMDAAEVDDFDANPELLGTPGGVIDLRTGEVRSATVGDKVTQSTDVAPAQAGASASRWLEFLSQVFEGDKETLEFIERLVGSALVGNVSAQKFFVLYGRGSNGKSVLRDVVSCLVGSYAGTASAKVFMQSHSDRHPTEIASLAGKRVVMASEVPAGRSWNDALLKELTGGEKMTTRWVHQNEFSFTPRGTLIFTANTLPSFTGAQEAMLRRIVIIEFKRNFTEDEQDPNLVADLISTEGSAILRWAIDGARKFLADGGGVRGLRIPQSITDATRTYFEEEDIVLQFLIDAQGSAATSIDWSPGAFVSCSQLFDEFRRWAESKGHKSWSVRTLSKVIRENAERYELSDVRTKAARGFRVERRLTEPPTGANSKFAKHVAIKRRRAVKK
ncbi:putative phage DNA primase [Octadecabacter antarcticus 307]|uniref:Putative phage DNA primase n=1 Tax=Octadecabacter antarcticus 307 TaxID=391626 RepID=M9RCT4_9RHOB|nr:phage/plasmid primase, P4 family [Octadecabacter antarcticus]AGI68231.1 putative phage DNA primase [Octadecabacter antarcticus 307]